MLKESVGKEFGQGIEPMASFCSKMSGSSAGTTRQLGLLHSSEMEPFGGVFTHVYVGWFWLLTGTSPETMAKVCGLSLWHTFPQMASADLHFLNGHSELTSSVSLKKVEVAWAFSICIGSYAVSFLPLSIGYKWATKLPDLAWGGG